MKDKPKIIINNIGGNCPVQAGGTINGHKFYFRARGEHWSLSIGGPNVVGHPVWYYEEPYGEWPAAGWMELDEAEAFIEKGAELLNPSWAESMRPPAKEEPDAPSES